MSMLNEKCAVTAVIATNGDNAAAHVYEALFAMQHRGAEASGIASSDGKGVFSKHRKPGLVRDVYDEETIHLLSGGLAIGHNRYSTSGSKTAHLQPFVDPTIQFAFAHNGNLPDTTLLENYLKKNNIKTDQYNDSEMMGLIIARFISNGQSLPDSVALAYPYFKGAFSCVAMHDGLVVAFRDSKGIRPLALGSFDGGVAVSSETCGLDIINATYTREIKPGEMVIISKDGTVSSQRLAKGEEKLDIFEFVYFARHDSYLYGKSVNEVRRKFGEQLAMLHPFENEDGQTVVVPVPDTSAPAAEGYAYSLGLTLRNVIIKNRYIGRTFMQPSNESRNSQLRRKHNIIAEPIRDKNVILIDDSIVRLNTMPRLVEQAYKRGARSVKVLIACPPVRFPDFYGIDTPAQNELAAANMTVEEMRERIGCEYLGFLTLSGVIAATGIPADKFNLSCFTGKYPISIGVNAKNIVAPISMEYIDEKETRLSTPSHTRAHQKPTKKLARA